MFGSGAPMTGMVITLDLLAMVLLGQKTLKTTKTRQIKRCEAAHSS
jgi:hypothetical protein